MSPHPAVEEVEVLGEELAGREGGEHQLRVDAEPVEELDALACIPGTHGVVTPAPLR